MLERLVRYLVGHDRLVQVISEKRYVKAPRETPTATTSDACLPRRARDQGRELDGKNVLILVRYALRNERVSTTRRTLARRQ